MSKPGERHPLSVVAVTEKNACVTERVEKHVPPVVSASSANRYATHLYVLKDRGRADLESSTDDRQRFAS